MTSAALGYRSEYRVESGKAMYQKTDILRASQPYCVLNTRDFCQVIYRWSGISHFYQFKTELDKELYVVPDACIDLIFQYKEDGSMQSFVCGTVQQYRECKWLGEGKEIFGVRFLPGYHPAGLNISQRELVDQKIPLSAFSAMKKIVEAVEKSSLFNQRIQAFMQEYTVLEKTAEKPFGKRQLVYSVKDMVYQAEGRIRISELAEKTGYSERYINKVFIEEMGFPPKSFCKMIQFQKAIEFLDFHDPGRSIEAAVALGYYDQPQFIREFKKYCGITPKKYQCLLKEYHYRERIKDLQP